MCSRVKTLSERPDWRVSSAAVVPVKISWLTIPPSEPSSRGHGALDATSSASRFGQGPSRRPQRVFPDRRPPHTTRGQGCAPNSSQNLCVFVFLTTLWNALCSILLTHSRLPGTTARFRIQSFS